MKKPMSNRTKTYILMILPALILFIAFNTIPLITGAFYSLTNYRGYGSYDFVGLRNFKDLFQDSRIGKSYLGTKYVANTLDQDGEESLVIRTDAVDCLTFVEYTLAQALGSSFADNLQKIRYRDGIINGYPSRLHYTSEWIENGIRHGFLTDITAKNLSLIHI